MAKQRRKYMYGKAHHIQFPCQKRISEIFSEYLDKVRQLSSDYQINNLMVDLRNEMYRVINEIYQHLSVELKYNATIKPKDRKEFDLVESTGEHQCEICGEKRAVDVCHIIPREHSGSGLVGNVIYLCPTHHFLFDQARLSEGEFERIDVSKKAEDSVDFFMKVHVVRHRMYWKYGTNKSAGCTCGSLDFYYDVAENGNLVQPCLVCKKCKAVWILGYRHPLVKEFSIEAYDIDDQITDEKRQKLINKAKNILRDKLAEQNPTLFQMR